MNWHHSSEWGPLELRQLRLVLSWGTTFKVYSSPQLRTAQNRQWSHFWVEWCRVQVLKCKAYWHVCCCSLFLLQGTNNELAASVPLHYFKVIVSYLHYGLPPLLLNAHSSPQLWQEGSDLAASSFLNCYLCIRVMAWLSTKYVFLGFKMNCSMQPNSNGKCK